MSSSKFSSSPPAHKRPPVCHKSPPDSKPPLPETPPRQLQASIHQVDLDPLATSNQRAFFQITRNAASTDYFGRTAPAGIRLELTFKPAATPNNWNAKLDVWDAYRHPETFTYSNVFVDPLNPFDTGLFGDVIISGRDFRRIQVAE